MDEPLALTVEEVEIGVRAADGLRRENVFDPAYAFLVINHRFYLAGLLSLGFTLASTDYGASAVVRMRR